MLALSRIERSVAAVLKGPDLSAEQRLEAKTMLPIVLRMQEHPDLAIIATSGTFLPPHERLMLRRAHMGAQTNVFVCSRGTSKTSTIDVLYANYVALWFPKRRGIILNATGFRGGQFILNDAARWITGGWDGQESGLEFYARSIPNTKIVHRAANFWQIDYDSMSALVTVPTNDDEKLRGIRGHDLYLDEANTMDDVLIEKVAIPFLNVTGGFRSGGLDGLKNRVFYTTTIDYSWRNFNTTQHAAHQAIERDYLAAKARDEGDRERFIALTREGLATKAYLNLDYTDTIVHRVLTARDGRQFRVNYPYNPYNQRFRFVRFEEGIPFTVRDEQGNLLQDGPPIDAMKTYPLDTNMLEQKLRDGTGSVTSWLSEQRNVLDSAVGDVYPNHVVDAAALVGSRCVLPYAKCPPTWRELHKATELDYSPGIQWTCTDPCIVGVDYAGGDRDFSALVIIRLGPLARGEFDPASGHGQTDWSNVIWCEMHRLTSHEDVANKIREYRTRYNIVHVFDQYEEDTWKACRGVGLDMRGGGTGVRDELVYINKEELGPGEVRIYDPLDKDERVVGFARDPKAIPLLDAIWPSDQLNDKLVEFTLGQMQQKLLYLPKLVNDGAVNIERRLRIGWNGAEALVHQLRKLQSAPTKNYHTYFMKGDKLAVENKKDLWAAFIYAAKQMRAHIIRHRMITDTPPPAGGRIAHIGSGRSFNGRIPGTKLG